jgi:citrate synthase
MSMHWDTEISYTTPEEIRIRGYDLSKLIGRVPFSHMVHLMFTGELPTPAVGRLVDALMVASIDHGAGTPSVLAARTAATGGANLKNAATAGLLTLDRFHGAAIEECMGILETIIGTCEDSLSPEAIEKAAETVVREIRNHGGRVPGFGHRQHATDPRVEKLFQLTREAGVEGKYIEAAWAIIAALKNVTGKDLPINIDGAVAVILCELHYPTGLGNAPFLVARFTGILAHAHEEITKMPRMRRIDPLDHGYCGPAPRELDENWIDASHLSEEYRKHD